MSVSAFWCLRFETHSLFVSGRRQCDKSSIQETDKKLGELVDQCSQNSEELATREDQLQRLKDQLLSDRQLVTAKEKQISELVSSLQSADRKTSLAATMFRWKSKSTQAAWHAQRMSFGRRLLHKSVMKQLRDIKRRTLHFMQQHFRIAKSHSFGLLMLATVRSNQQQALEKDSKIKVVRQLHLVMNHMKCRVRGLLILRHVMGGRMRDFEKGGMGAAIGEWSVFTQLAISQLSCWKLRAPFVQWQTKAAKWEAQNAGLQSVLMRMETLRKRVSFVAWRSHLEVHDVGLTALQDGIKLLILLGNRVFVASLLRWRGYCEDRIQVQWASQQGLSHWVHSNLEKAVEKWRPLVAIKATEVLLRRGLMRMIKAKLTAAFTRWLESAREARAEAWLSGGAIRRMLNRKLSMAWEKWQFTAAEMARQQFMMAGALNRMLKRADVWWHGRSGSRCMLI